MTVNGKHSSLLWNGINVFIKQVPIVSKQNKIIWYFKNCLKFLKIPVPFFHFELCLNNSQEKQQISKKKLTVKNVFFCRNGQSCRKSGNTLFGRKTFGLQTLGQYIYMSKPQWNSTFLRLSLIIEGATEKVLQFKGNIIL